MEHPKPANNTLKFLQSVLDAVPCAVFWKDCESRYLGGNQHFLELVGRDSVEQILGTSDYDMPWRRDAEALRADDIAVIEGREQREFERVIPGDDDTLRRVHTVKAPLYDGRGAVIGVIAAMQDVTRAHDALSALALQEARYQLVVEAAGAGTWDWNLAEKTLELSDRWISMLGYAREDLEPITTDTWPALCDPDAWERSRQLLAPTLKGEVEQYECPVRLRRKDGTWADILDLGRVIERDDEGRAVRMLGVHIDISDLRKREREFGVIADVLGCPASDKLLDNLLHVAAALSGADYAHVARVDERADEATIIANWPPGAVPVGSSYPLSDSPCGLAVKDDRCFVNGDLFDAFPEDEAIEALGLDAYAGQRLIAADGRVIGVFILTRKCAFDDPEATMNAMSILASRAVHELERHEQEQRQRVLATAFATQGGVLITNADRVILEANPGIEQITGLGAPSLCGARFSALHSTTHDATFYDAVWQAVESDGHWSGEMWLRTADDGHVPTWMIITAVRDESSRVSHYVCSVTDMSETLQARRDVERLAFYDPLTTLPNRRFLLDRLDAMLASSRRRGEFGALLCVDLDHFKNINDTLGHQSGDEFLRDVALRIKRGVRTEDVVARLGGDEFLVVLGNLGRNTESASEKALHLAEKLRASLGAPFTIKGREFVVHATVGVTVFPDADCGSGEIMAQADAAMYHGKRDGRDKATLYSAEIRAEISQRMTMELDLRRAIERREFMIYYQPQVDQEGSIIGAEALIRWQHPTSGFVPPDTFIPLAEELGLVHHIDHWVLREGVQDLHNWQALGTVDIEHLSINVSAEQFYAPGFVGYIDSLLGEFPVEKDTLVIEITERAVIQDIEVAARTIRSLRDRGVRTSVDDFGIGYSSLAYLRHLPIDQLKIDRAFVDGIETDVNAAVIAETIVNLGLRLHLETIAEGVENDAQRVFLSALGCSKYQGYLFCRPLPKAEFLEFATANT